uniref:DNA-binding protein H-NS n=1 Tax=Vibrio splendidus TaxID=29497 RepID=A0A0H3ZSW1_VIBSP|nr:DNA-binding protein H-NS [Vibrio splendidus]
MNPMIKTLLNIRTLRAFSRELTFEQLEDALDKLTTVYLERQESEEAEREARAEKEAKVAEMAKQMSESGIGVEDLLAALSGQPKTKKFVNQDPRNTNTLMRAALKKHGPDKVAHLRPFKRN